MLKWINYYFSLITIDLLPCTVVLFNGIGQHVRQINSDNVVDVRFHSGRLFCVSVENGKSNVVIHVYDLLTWQRISLIQSPCRCRHGSLHTMHVGSEYITLACSGTSTIHTMTHAGDLVNVMKTNGYPRLCHTGSDAVLVAEWLNNYLRLQNEGNWSQVLLRPPPLIPRDAVYVGGSLFVLSEWNLTIRKDRIIKYIRKWYIFCDLVLSNAMHFNWKRRKIVDS